MFWGAFTENIKTEQKITPQSDTENLAKPESSQIALFSGCWWLSNSWAIKSSIAASFINSFLPPLHSHLLWTILCNVFFLCLLAPLFLFLGATFQTRTLVSEREMCCCRWELPLLNRDRWGQKDVKMLGVHSCCFLKGALYHTLSHISVGMQLLWHPSYMCQAPRQCLASCLWLQGTCVEVGTPLEPGQLIVHLAHFL